MVRPGSSSPLWGVAGKAGYALSCVAAALVLAISGFSYFVVRDVSSIGGSHAIVSGPSVGAQNILLMGLESRTDWRAAPTGTATYFLTVFLTLCTPAVRRAWRRGSAATPPTR